MLFLTKDEVIELTGYKKPALQRRWLIEHGYKFEVRADGRPVVLASTIEHKLRGKAPAQVSPDWSALE